MFNGVSYFTCCTVLLSFPQFLSIGAAMLDGVAHSYFIYSILAGGGVQKCLGCGILIYLLLRASCQVSETQDNFGKYPTTTLSVRISNDPEERGEKKCHL
jgi:hypothetical protein